MAHDTLSEDSVVLGDDSKLALEYEKVMQKYEADIRNHIMVEQQLKLHIETLNTKIEENEKLMEAMTRKHFDQIEQSKQENNKLKHNIKEKDTQIVELSANVDRLQTEVSEVEIKVKKESAKEIAQIKKENDALRYRLSTQASTNCSSTGGDSKQSKTMDPLSLVQACKDFMTKEQKETKDIKKKTDLSRQFFETIQNFNRGSISSQDQNKPVISGSISSNLDLGTRNSLSLIPNNSVKRKESSGSYIKLLKSSNNKIVSSKTRVNAVSGVSRNSTGKEMNKTTNSIMDNKENIWHSNQQLPLKSYRGDSKSKDRTRTTSDNTRPLKVQDINKAKKPNGTPLLGHRRKGADLNF